MEEEADQPMAVDELATVAEPSVVSGPGVGDAVAGSTPVDAAAPRSDDEPRSAREVVPQLVRRVATLLRTSRLAAGAAFVGLIVVGLLLLGGGKAAPGSAAAVASPGAPQVTRVPVEPGAATLILTGGIESTYTLVGAPGPGTPLAAGTVLSATWADTLQDAFALQGAADRGTRTTDANLVLSWSVTVDGQVVTFTSAAGECTIGMAMHPANVSGTFNCHKVKSADGKLTVGASGTYRT